MVLQLIQSSRCKLVAAAVDLSDRYFLLLTSFSQTEHCPDVQIFTMWARFVLNKVIYCKKFSVCQSFSMYFLHVIVLYNVGNVGIK